MLVYWSVLTIDPQFQRDDPPFVASQDASRLMPARGGARSDWPSVNPRELRLVEPKPPVLVPKRMRMRQDGAEDLFSKISGAKSLMKKLGVNLWKQENTTSGAFDQNDPFGKKTFCVMLVFLAVIRTTEPIHSQKKLESSNFLYKDTSFFRLSLFLKVAFIVNQFLF